MEVLNDHLPFPPARNFDPESSFHDIEKGVAEGNLLNVISEFRKMKEKMSRNPVSVAVTGDSGNGMSSFINALRNIGHEQEDSAPTGVVRTTQKPTCYSSPNFPNAQLWDLPGLGTTAQSVESYLEEVQGSQYDLFVLVASEQFSSNHVQLARAIQGMGKRFHVVWTKVDRDCNTHYSADFQVFQNIKKNIQENLQKEGLKLPPIFLISNFDPSSFDFPVLRKTLQDDIFNIRYHHPLKTLYRICDKSIEGKAVSMKDTELKRYFQGNLTTMGAEDLRECLESYRDLFGVDNLSLQEMAKSMNRGTDLTEYRVFEMKSQNLNAACQRDWGLRLLMCTGVNKFLEFLGCWFWYGWCDRVIHGFGHLRIRRIIEVIAQDTKIILRKIVEDSISVNEL